MKKTIEQVIFAILFIIGGICQVSCNQKVAKEPVESQVAEKESTCLTAVDDYLVNEFGKHYVQGDVCIPCAYVIDKDESNADDILVWGDFWVFNYKLSGDTLKTVSGGAHPGLMHVQKTDDGSNGKTDKDTCENISGLCGDKEHQDNRDQHEQCSGIGSA